MQEKSVPFADLRRVPTDPQLSVPNQLWLMATVAAALLIPCVWQKHIEAGDLASHLYNAWLAGQIQHGTISGLTVAHPLTNVLADWIFSILLGPLGPVWTARVVCGLAVEVFFWGAFRFIAVVNRTNPLMMAPCLGMLSYGMIFHFGFLNFYISTGLSLWIMALLWEIDRGSLLKALPLAVLALLAHALPLAWAVAAVVYLHLARKMLPPQRILLLAVGVVFLVAIQTQIMRHFASHWSLQELMNTESLLGLTGAGQVLLHGRKYLIIAAGVLVLWLLLFLERLDRGGMTTDPMVHLWLLNIAAFVLLPSGIQFPPYQFSLLFIPERVSLFGAILFCSILSRGRHGRGITRLSGLVAVSFFTLLYLDARAINGVDAEISALVTALPPGQRVVASLKDRGEGLNGLSHVLDWACIGHCFDYANYEPGTGQFRIRVVGPNEVVAPTIEIAQKLENGHYLVTPQEAPLYSICAGAGTDHRFELRKLKAGDVTCGFSLAVTPSLLEDPQPVP